MMTDPIILPGFWHSWRAVNAQTAIFHQWRQLERTGCIENFRIAAGLSEGVHTGWFFADSDAYKWLEAAARILGYDPNPRLSELVDGFIALLARTQTPDGYLFTYNQIHFPGVRWQNLQIEHELYCHGHLIEAGVTDYEVSGRRDLLEIALRAADRIAVDFSGKDAEYTPGHEEIEIALLRLHQIAPGEGTYLRLARQFIEQRGRIKCFALHILRQSRSAGQRTTYVRKQREKYLTEHPIVKPFQLPPGNVSKKRNISKLRWYVSALTGRYFQQHKPVREQIVPVGHAVRFTYLETAAAMLARLRGDRTLLPTLEQAWEHMVTRRMYLTGGIGSQAGLEGFGDDYELDPRYAYAETCATLGSLFWNWEMAQLTGESKYSDLFEWQLYNAAAVGMGLNGTDYLYNNPLACVGEVTRQPWFEVPCCPPNLSRTWANLGKYIFSTGAAGLRIHQYISCRLENQTVFTTGGEPVRVSLELNSAFPWEGAVSIKVTALEKDRPAYINLLLRQPSWATGARVSVNGSALVIAGEIDLSTGSTASGFDPRQSVFQRISRAWQPGDQVQVNFEMPAVLRRAHPKVSGHRGKVAVTRGPLVYCLESLDHPDLDIFSARLDPATLIPISDESLLGGIVKILGKTTDGRQLTFIPYFLWANRGPSQMTVWVNCA